MPDTRRRLPPDFVPIGYESRRHYLVDYARNDVISALSDDNFSRAERSQLIKDLANGPFASVLLPQSNGGPSSRNAELATQGDQVIGRALEQSVQDGQLDVDGMHKLARAGDPNGQQRVLTVLQKGGFGSGSGVEKYADSLWAQRDNLGMGNNAAVAAIAYMSDPVLRAAKLRDPEQRQQAFEALIDFNAKAPYAKVGEPVGGEMKRNAQVAAATLFRDHGQELIAAYTEGAMRTGPLAKFLSQSMFDPAAKDLKLDDGRDVATAVGNALKQSATDCIVKADDPSMQGANRPSREQERQLEKLARIGASVSGGVAHAWDAYKDKIGENEQSQKAFVAVVGKAVGLVPVSGLAKDATDKIAEEAAMRIAKAFLKDPVRPDVEIGEAMNQYYADLVRDLANKRNQSGLTTDTFGQAYRQEYDHLTDKVDGRPGKSASLDMAVQGDRVASVDHALVDRLSASMNGGDREAYRRQLGALADQDGRSLRQEAVAAVDALERQTAESQNAIGIDAQVEAVRSPRRI